MDYSLAFEAAKKVTHKFETAEGVIYTFLKKQEVLFTHFVTAKGANYPFFEKAIGSIYSLL